VRKNPRPVYELVDLLGKHIDDQFYGEEINPVIVTNTAYLIKYCARKSEKALSNISFAVEDITLILIRGSQPRSKKMASNNPDHFYVTVE
jgi:hypothetical protein